MTTLNDRRSYLGGFMRSQRIRHLVEYFALRVLACVVQALSPRACARVAEILARVIHYGLPRRWSRYVIAHENIRLAFAGQYDDRQIDFIIFRMWVHLLRLLTEMLQSPRKLRLNSVVSGIVFRNKPDVVKALCSDRPVLLLSGHVGNFEMAISIFGLFGFKMGLVARDLDNPYLNRWFFDSRRHTGHRPISKNGGGGTMVAVLERGGSLAMLGDQDAGKSGLFVEFFGRPASSFKSIALLAMEYKALICVGYALRLDGAPSASGWPRFELGCEAVIDPLDFQSGDALREITQCYTSALERVVRRAPEQYFWVHRRWKNQPGDRRRRKKGPSAGPPPRDQEPPEIASPRAA